MSENRVVVIKGDPNIAKKKAAEQAGRKIRVAAYCRVSTMADEQIDSFKSQVAYYTSLINSNPEWENAGIYADEGLSGTQADKRPQFLKMVAAAMNGQIDIILVKSLSRFGRNTVDNLNYIRAFKEKNVAIRFEEEGIDTSKESGEIMITILSSCAQQEVQNTSEHVKTGLKMIMSRGQLIGYNGCLGYDYDKATKSIKVNKEEAKIVRYIFSRYLQGAGTTVLARELSELGYKGKDGSLRWFDSTILGIIKNEKYKGDIIQGKTFTVDPITKRRLRNFGESDQYCIQNHHEAIVSEADWNKAQEIIKQRSYCRRLPSDGSRIKLSRKYTFSTVMECGFCHGTIVRRRWCGGKNGPIPIWQCVNYSKKGKELCPCSKGIPEFVIQGAFVDIYNAVISGKDAVMDEILSVSESTIGKSDFALQKKANQRLLDENKAKRDKLVGLYLNRAVDEQTYQKEYGKLEKDEKNLQAEKDRMEFAEAQQSESSDRLERFRKFISANGKGPIKEFDSALFDTCIDKVVIGGKDKGGNEDSYQMTFIFKASFAGVIAPEKGEKVAIDSGKYVVIGEAHHYWQHATFVQSGRHERQKRIKDLVNLIAVVDTLDS